MNQLNIDLIRTDGGTQPRAKLNQAVIQDYAEEMQRGVEFPPIIVFFDGENYWLTDGFHRLAATELVGASTINADVRSGPLRDAILFSVGVNAAHGLRRTNADKRRAVEIMLCDPEWSLWSDREIARRCAVSDRFVNNVRKKMQHKPVDLAQEANASIQKRKVLRNGKVYTLNTANIGCSKIRSGLKTSMGSTIQASSEYCDVDPHQTSVLPNHHNNRNKPSPRIRVRTLDLTSSSFDPEGQDVFRLQSPTIQAEIVCTPSLMASLLKHLRDYPSFVEALLKQVDFCQGASLQKF